MNIETKYNIGQEVWFVDDGHPTTAQVEAFDYAYGIGVVYLVRLLEAGTLAFCVRAETELFHTKEELLKSL
ncbi:MAG: hypothetical protein J6Q61_09720 [Bacteroidales bacterium]|nr:hypothetical protein [Bacteroidales bacterium]